MTLMLKTRLTWASSSVRLRMRKIKSIDLSKVASSPEFIASLTGEDLLKEGVHPVAQNPWPPQKHANRYHLAVDKVRFAGEPVAAILAKSKSSVEDLIDLVEVEYEQLPVITTIEESKQKKALLYDEWKDNLSQTNEEKKGDAAKSDLIGFLRGQREIGNKEAGWRSD